MESQKIEPLETVISQLVVEEAKVTGIQMMNANNTKATNDLFILLKDKLEDIKHFKSILYR